MTTPFAQVVADLVNALADVVPPGFRLELVGDEVTIESPDGLPAAFWVGDLPEQEVDASELAAIGYRVLSNTQDEVCMTLRECWPRLDGAGVRQAMPGATVQDGYLRCWFGEAQHPVLALPPIRLTGEES